jgi:integrase/recombinase XerD
VNTDTNSFCALSSRLRELLKAEAYSESTLKDMDFILKAMSDYMQTLNLEEYTPEIGERFVVHCGEKLQVCASRISRAKNIVGKLNRLLHGLDGRKALLPDKTEKIDLPEDLRKALNAYLDYCVSNGNRQLTCDYKHWICSRFLANLAGMGCTKVGNMTGEMVQAAFLSLGYTRYWERIGPFLRFLFDAELLSHNYSMLIRHRRKHMPQPTVYSPDEVSCVENSFDMSLPRDIRNHAITLLMARYGIRSCDIAALTFDNLDFNNSRICFIQQKTGDSWENKLFPEVQTAIRKYIEAVRPNLVDCTRVFITMTPPYTPLTSYAINSMIWKRFKLAGVDIAGRRHGGRAFRSSIASNMVNDGVSTEIVRKVLGHDTKYALKHYARIDMESMRLCPLPVPNPTGTFADCLSGKEVNSRA